VLRKLLRHLRSKFGQPIELQISRMRTQIASKPPAEGRPAVE
jgi:hypothetical protein